MMHAQEKEVGRLMAMHVARRPRKALVELVLAFAIAVVLGAINWAVNYSRPLADFLDAYRGVPWADIIINLLFFWMALLLVVAFRRWRAAEGVQVELEDVISSISPDVLLVAMPNRDIVMCNSSVERMFGYAPLDVIGKKTDSLYFDRRTDESRPREIYDALERDGFHVGAAKGKRQDGSTFPLEIIAGELTGHAGAVLLLRDVTERRDAEARRLALEKRIQLQHKMESLGILAGGVSHDFNNLLTVIRGNGEILGGCVEDAEPQAECVKAILSASDRAAALCRQMLAYAGEGEFTIEPLDLSELVGKTSRLLGVSLGKGVRMTCHLDEHLPPVRGDAVQLQQVVMNLVMNASEAIGKEDGQVTVATGIDAFDADFIARHCVDAELGPGRYVYLEVRDTGQGIDQETLSRIFDPFFTTKSGGRGLGLATVIGIVKSHKGTIAVESEAGQGTVFRVLFPLEAVHGTLEA